LQKLADSLTADDLVNCAQKWLARFTPFFTVGASLKGIHFRRFGVGHLARRRVRNTPVR